MPGTVIIPVLPATTPAPTKFKVEAAVLTVIPSSWTAMVLPTAGIVTVTTFPTAEAVTPAPTKFMLLAVAATMVPSSLTETPAIPPGMVTSTSPVSGLPTVAVTPAPIKFRLLATAVKIRLSSLTIMIPLPPPPPKMIIPPGVDPSLMRRVCVTLSYQILSS